MKLIELVPFWKQGNGDMKSAELMDDRIQDLIEAMQRGPVRLYLRKTGIKRTSKSPDASLLILPQRKG